MRRVLMLSAAVLAACLMSPGPVAADGPHVKLDVTPIRSTLKAGEKQSTWIRVGLEGFELKSDGERAPVNVAIVLDKSGSMKGDSIRRAREAAIDAIELLGPDDIVSVITYDTNVSVIIPATKLTDKDSVRKAIAGITAGGNTALFAGVSKGAAEIRKFAAEEYVNRVILLSDGKANVGPSSPGELGALGTSLKKENISVSTMGLGLGYNEDLMTNLAVSSGGNHLFIEDAAELADIFNAEFSDVLSVVAQEIDVRVLIPEGIRPVRVLGNDADVNGQEVITRLAQVYSRQKKHVVVELELPESEAGAEMPLATVTVAYRNMQTGEADRLSGKGTVKFCDTEEESAGSVNTGVLADVVALVSSEKSKLATILLDQGDIAACRATLEENCLFLEQNRLVCPGDARLENLSRSNGWQLRELQEVTSNSDVKANSARKAMRAYQSAVDSQQTAQPTAPPSGP